MLSSDRCPQDAALFAMRSEVIAEVTKLRNQELKQAQQELQQQLQQQVPSNLPMLITKLHSSCCMLIASVFMSMPE